MRLHTVAYRFGGVVSSDAADWVESLAGTPFGAQPGWRPRTDVWETASELVVRVDLPGIRDADARIVVFPDALVVEGERVVERVPGGRCHLAEARRGPFRVAVRLPAQVAGDTADALFERGVLTVRLAKTGAAG